MEEYIKQIVDLMKKSAITAYTKGSCGELGDSFQALDSDDFEAVAIDVLTKIKPQIEGKAISELAITELVKNHNQGLSSIRLLTSQREKKLSYEPVTKAMREEELLIVINRYDTTYELALECLKILKKDFPERYGTIEL